MTSENIYQAPEAELVVTSSDEEKLQFFTTTIRKLIILSICTFNIYSLIGFTNIGKRKNLALELIVSRC